MEGKKREWFGIIGMVIGIVSYMGGRSFLWLPVLGFVLSLVGLCIFDTNKHRQKWYAIFGVILGTISFVLGINDQYTQ